MRAPTCYSMVGYCKHHLYSAVLIAILLFQCASSDNQQDIDALLRFKDSLGHKVRLKDWTTPGPPPCNKGKPIWDGVLCDKNGLMGLNLQNMDLFGIIDLDSLKELTNLRTISIIKNNFNGTFPKINKLPDLKTIYFSQNNFSGEIDPKAFEGMNLLKKIHLANNQFSGSIPSVLTTLPNLVELQLEGNKFSGEIPDFKLGIMKTFNVSNNQLKGPVPKSLGKIEASSFQGNAGLCGAPLEESCPSSPPAPEPSTSSSSAGSPVGKIIGIVVGVIILLAIIIVIVLVVLKRKKNSETNTDDASVLVPNEGKRAMAPSDLDHMEKGSNPSPGSTTKKGENGMKMTFLREDVERFEMGDLLKASAEVLGSGHFGSSYRALLPSGKMMVVKRFRHMNNVGKEEFQEHMRRIGRLSHPNLLPLVAFYYRKEEKLLVADYIDNVNLAVHLHGNRSRGQPSPNWPQRLNIIKGVAKGLQYLYSELPSLMLPHGHLKSSNVLLTPALEPLLTDYALVPVVNQEHAQDVMVAYKSPEYKHRDRVSKKTDVWSFGILILEILTGKFPSNFLHQGKGSETDLVNWVESIMNDEDWSASDLFDKEMGGIPSGSEGQMMKLLKIGLACAANDVENRLDVKEAAHKIEEVNEKDNDASEGGAISEK